MDSTYCTEFGRVIGYKYHLFDNNAITYLLVCGQRVGWGGGGGNNNCHHHETNPNEGSKGDLTDQLGGRGLRLGWIGWRHILQG